MVVHLPGGVIPAQSPDIAFPSQRSFVKPTEVFMTTSHPSAFIAAEFSDQEFPSTGQFIIGGQDQPNDFPELYTNPNLPAGVYTFFLRAFPRLALTTRQSVSMQFIYTSRVYHRRLK